MALFRKLATRIVWTLDARPFRQRGVFFHAAVQHRGPRISTVYETKPNLNEGASQARTSGLFLTAIMWLTCRPHSLLYSACDWTDGLDDSQPDAEAATALNKAIAHLGHDRLGNGNAVRP